MGAKLPDLATAIADHLPHSLVVRNMSGVVTAWNAAAERLYGWSCAEALGRVADDLLGSCHAVDNAAIAGQLLRNRRWAGETFRTTRDGREICVAILWTVACVDGCDIIVESAHDIVTVGDRQPAEAALRQSQSDYAHAARVATLGEMTASIAHEVNQPLAALSTYGQAIRRWIDRPVPDLDEVRMLADYVVADAQRASGIIARIRAMAAKSAPRSERLSLNDVVGEALEIVRNELFVAGVEIRMVLAEMLPPFLGDRVQMQQVIVNLAINAVQAMTDTPHTGRIIRITTLQSDPAMVEMVVEDTGPGVPADIRDHLFTSFFSTKENGMGIGLPICRSIVETYEGDIQLQDSASGARFRIRLPVAEI